MKKYFKVIIVSMIFIILNCGSGEETVDIQFDAYLFRTVGTSEAVIDLSYYSTPVGSFKIDEIWISAHKLNVPAKEAKGSVASRGIILSAESVQYKNEKIPFDQSERELTLKTKWQGQKREELKKEYVLPSDFEINSVSNKISSAVPFIIELKQDLIHENWDNCGLVFRNEKQDKEETRLDYYLKPDFSSITSDQNDKKTRKIELKLDIIQKNRVDQNATMPLPENFYMQLVCVKNFQSPEKIVEQGYARLRSSNKFNYQLSSDIYPIKIIQ